MAGAAAGSGWATDGVVAQVDLPHALLRGRYMAAAAIMEFNGTPIDLDMLAILRAGWTDIQDQLIAEIDGAYGVFDGRTFKTERFEQYLIRHGIPWPRLESGRLDLEDDCFRQMAKSHPIVSPLRELRSALSDLRLNDLAVGRDGRNRTILSAFRSRTGRNQPSNSKYIFGPSVWLRGLIKPPPGHGVAYIDWSQQEFGIAAALSGDLAMAAAYHSGDPYLTFGKHSAFMPYCTASTHCLNSSRCALWVALVASVGIAPAWHWPTNDRRPRSVGCPPRNLPAVLALVGCRRGCGHAQRLTAHGFWLACSYRRTV